MSADARGARPHVVAAAVLFAHFLAFAQGTPGFDFMKTSDFNSDEERAQLIEDVGPIAGNIGIALYALNREVRRPVTDKLHLLERPFRLSQDWNLYRDGPSRVRRLEILVDGDLKYRSGDPKHDWLEPHLHNRRIRPIIENMSRTDDVKNWRGVTRYVTRRAREDFPDCDRIEIRALQGRFPGEKMWKHHAWVAGDPGWAPRAIPAKKKKKKDKANAGGTE
jgi:hypothetical protein